MKLTPRLAAIAKLIPAGSVVADIGTDHAYLPLYLVQEQVCPRVVASDLNPAPLAQARETVAAFNCLHKIDLRLGNGLAVLSPEDGIDTVVIAGLGGHTIIKILQEGLDRVPGLKRLILQPMKESGALRVWLAQNNFALAGETLVLEGNRLYEIILAAPGKEKEKDLFRLSLGPRLLENKPVLLDRLLREKIRKMETVRNSLKRSKSDRTERKLKEVEEILANLEEVLSNADSHRDAD